MRPRDIAKFIAAAAFVVSTPASAQQLYKWVDERGVTNYSNQPPSDPRTARNVRAVEDRLSVYSPDQGLVQAIEDGHKNFDQRQRERARIEALERQLEAERSARQQSAAAAQQSQLAYDQCIADGRPDCNAIYGVYSPYYPPVVVAPPRHRRQPIPQAVLTPGATAGNVTADNNFIPGNSATARPAPPGESVHRRSPERRSGRIEERPLLERR